MKVFRVLSLLTVFLSVLILVECAKPNEKLFYGTFTNDKISPQKTVLATGSFKDYALVSDSSPIQEGTERVIKVWTDSEGNTLIQKYATITAGPNKNTVPKAQTLTRISKDETTLEFMWNGVVEFNPNSFPTTIDPTDVLRYRVYNRVGD